jgi:spore coat polysaccharide biosynthesis protein SpsF (cytidylyltransferase family)
VKAIFISVRLGSTRLPKKAILDLCGEPSIQYLIKNLKSSRHADKIILCTTLKSEDDVLCELAEKNGIEFFRGSTDDKLSRWLGACKKNNIEFFVNVDGDDLFFDTPLADLCLSQSTGIDFVDGRGLYNDVYGIRATALELVCKLKSASNTEFIRPHFIDPVKKFNTNKVQNIPNKYKKRNIRMTLDYVEDYKFFETVLKHFKQLNVAPTFDKILQFLQNNPEVVKINWFREEEWKSNQTEMINRVVL